MLRYAPTVLISSPPYYYRPEGELAIDFLVQKGYPRDKFAIFPHTARSTIAEALVLHGELERREAKQVLLVTSGYHSRRAAIVFALFCPGIHFISVPADDPKYEPDAWWKKADSRKLFFSELLKITGTVTLAYPVYLINRWRARFAESAQHANGEAQLRAASEASVISAANLPVKPAPIRGDAPRWHRNESGELWKSCRPESTLP